MQQIKTFRNHWIEYTPRLSKLNISYSLASYFDERHMITLCGFWGQLFIHLPFKSGINECETPSYGFYFYGEGTWWFDTFWIKMGYKIKCFHMPWEWDWVRTSNLRKDGQWENESRGNKKNFWDGKWDQIILYESFPYTYILEDGTVQNRTATIKTTEMEWRWRWFKNLSLIKKVRRYIDVRFDGEVGERTGSWKGGCTGCSYDMKKGETPLQCLQRMEAERKFK